MYFLLKPLFLVVNTIGISPVPPGGMGSLGQPFKTVHPHAALTDE